MHESFADKLAFVLKVLSISRARLAADLGVDKSVVARWASGAARPSAHNLARLSSLMSQKFPGFTALDWESDIDTLSSALGIEPRAAPAARASGAPPVLDLPLMDQILATTALRAAAYEGFYRSTRPYSGYAGNYVHDACLVRKGEDGLLRLKMASGGISVEGWVLPLQNQLFVIGAEITTGALVFAILHGANTIQAEVLDGLTLSTNLDVGRTPAATAIVLHRIGDLSGDVSADDARLTAMGAEDSMAAPGSVPESMRRHLARDVASDQATAGGSGVLRLPITASIARGGLPKLY
jgi:transcriptional regulator with XRE-family HTH domain